MPPFTFRQRASKINWNAITALKLNDVIVNTNIKKLQKVIDIVIFSYFDHEEVRNHSIESISKLVNILQLISEYLLHCQEEQFKLIRDSQSKLNKNMQAYDKVFKENMALKEDRKIYQRQLAILRKSLGPSFFLTKDELNEPMNYNLLIKPKATKEESNDNNTMIIHSILQREEDNRLFMSSMMNDQRQILIEQMKILTDSLINQKNNNNNDNNNTLVTELFFSKIESQVNHTIQNAVTNMEHKMQSTLETMQRSNKNLIHSQNNDINNENIPMTNQRKREVQDILQAAAEEVFNEMNPTISKSNKKTTSSQDLKKVIPSSKLEEQLNDITKREILMNEKEKELLLLERMLEAKEKDLLMISKHSNDKQLVLTSRIHHETERLNLLTANEVIKSNAQLLIVRKFFSSYLQIFQKRQSNAFRKWYRYVVDCREKDIHNHYGKQLLYTKDHRSKVEIDLVNQLKIEKDKHMNNIEKINQLENSIIILENKIKENNNDNNNNLNPEIEQKLKNELQLEKDKNIINNSKYNTLKKQTDLEIQDLKERLTAYELKYNPILSGFKSSGVNTSLDFMLATTNRYQTSTTNNIIPNSLRSSYQRLYMNQDEDEQDLYENALKRLNYRMKSQPEDLELKAISSLAIELNAKLNKSNLTESI